MLSCFFANIKYSVWVSGHFKLLGIKYWMEFHVGPCLIDRKAQADQQIHFIMCLRTLCAFLCGIIKRFYGKVQSCYKCKLILSMQITPLH